MAGQRKEKLMNLTTIHHVNHLGNRDSQTQDRQSVYRVEDNQDVIRITVHRDRSYVKQGYAFLEILNQRGEWTTLFNADRDQINHGEMWEVEDELLHSYSILAMLSYHKTNSEVALYTSGHLTDD